MARITATSVVVLSENARVRGRVVKCWTYYIGPEKRRTRMSDLENDWESVVRMAQE